MACSGHISTQVQHSMQSKMLTRHGLAVLQGIDFTGTGANAFGVAFASVVIDSNG